LPPASRRSAVEPGRRSRARGSAGAGRAAFASDACSAESIWDPFASRKPRVAQTITELSPFDRARTRSSHGRFRGCAAERAQRRSEPTGFIGAENAIADVAHVRKARHASYLYQYHLHTCLEPLNCTAHGQKHRCEIWCGSQALNSFVGELQKLLELPTASVAAVLNAMFAATGKRIRRIALEENAFALSSN
jgi:hypothetical protein